MTDFPVKSRVIRRQTIYWFVGIGLTAIFVTVQASDTTSGWRSGSQLHTIMETMATLVALIVGCLALFRYYSQKELAILFIGLGFLGTAFLDGYHTFVTSEYFAPLMPSDLPSLSPWSWIASRQYLSVLMLLSFLYSRHQSEAEPTNRTVNERSLEVVST
ncbi:MAG: hypothetical protein HN725_14560 [Alphaproteobacteria bacterium]|jgi:hypothetical protein|nr:hypothetical protein [Alphaproteobacteria bacterium]MBT4083922.1 hypothetical protein [Alphaproteobacteria bacterium]MBT4546224.1 hypothetical protein [Alphaproteobacteria bacterium]MBT7746509.1 hypothetical protein [Alphaproteobacteria bacterium]